MAYVDLGQCPVCGLVTYRTARERLRRHAPAGVSDPRSSCPGSGLQVPVVQRQAVES